MNIAGIPTVPYVTELVYLFHDYLCSNFPTLIRKDKRLCPVHDFYFF